MQTEALVGALFLLFVVQVIGTHLQVKEYKRAVRELHKRGNVGIGEILEGRIMQGMTILSRFRPIEGIAGRTIYDLHAEYASLPEKRRVHYKGHLQALDALITRLGDQQTV